MDLSHQILPQLTRKASDKRIGISSSSQLLDHLGNIKPLASGITEDRLGAVGVVFDEIFNQNMLVRGGVAGDGVYPPPTSFPRKGGANSSGIDKIRWWGHNEGLIWNK